MNKTQVTDLIKSVGSIIGTYIIAKGWIPVGVWNDLLAGIILFVSAGFGLKTTATPQLMKTIVSAAEVQPEVVPQLVKLIKENPKVQVAPATIWLG